MAQTKSSSQTKETNQDLKIITWIVLFLLGLNIVVFFEFLDRIRLYLWRTLTVQTPLTIGLNLLYLLLVMVIFSNFTRLTFYIKEETKQERVNIALGIIQASVILLGLFLGTEVILARLIAGGMI